MQLERNESRVLLATEAIKANPKLSVLAASKVYKVPRETLRDRIHGRSPRSDTTPRSRRLTDLEESTIVQYMLDLDARAFPPRLAGVEDMANRLIRDRDAPLVGKNWASNFVKRQAGLRTRFHRRYDYQRAQCEDPDAISAWFRLVQNTIAKYGI